MGSSSILKPVMCAVLVAGCGGPQVTPYTVTELRADVLVIATTCATGVSAETEETEAEVRVDNIEGESSTGDCLSVVSIPLSNPLGNRTLVVEGEVWEVLDDTCPYGTLGSPDLVDVDDRCGPKDDR